MIIKSGAVSVNYSNNTATHALEGRLSVLHFRIGRGLSRPVPVGTESDEVYGEVVASADELAIEGTMTLVTLQNGKPTEIPDSLRAAVSAETTIKK